MAVIQASTVERNIYLTLADVPATGLTPGDVVCKYRKDGQTALTTKTLDGSNWIEVGDGFYILKFTATEMDTLGYFFFTLSGPGFDNFLYDEFTIEPNPATAEGFVPPEICVVSGSVRNVGGQVSSQVRVVARPVQFPTTYGSNLINADAQWTYINSDGSFQLSLVRGSTVIIEIDRAGIRHQVVIPDAPTADLLDLLPPLPAA